MSAPQKGMLSRYVDFWNEREAPESLALLRITFAAALVANVLEQILSGMVLELYSVPEQGGVFPFARPQWRTPLSLFNILTPTPPAVWGLVLLQLLAAVFLLVGLFSRLASLVCFVIQVTLTDRMSIWAFGGDNVFRVFLYLLVLSPCGAAWSLDARWRRKGQPDVPCWPRRLFIFQLTVVYVCTGIMKIGSTWSFMGDWSALYLAVNLPGIARWPGDWAAWVFPLTQVATFVAKWWEITFFLVPLSLRQRRRKEEGKKLGPLRRLLARWDLRKPYMVLGVIFHISLTVLMDLGLFSVVMLSLYPCLLRPEEARRILTRFTPRHSPPDS
jgi:uncharacterized membrane protein YphA (DoxX/SURF4 family)